ncbi:glycosyltransferase [Marivita sp. GX14005]|uniref:glycosyltransferase family 2 protein n=1 Tax=Marivita sp. GX14005 TaxID=2942276 RepID=UPI002019638A|nr:glycosyltransferase [Marivita sp. GX14005]MCL3881764.1 glycosyltransferase [Marivita sp. GX14005]
MSMRTHVDKRRNVLAPIATVIIPASNEEAHIEACLSAVLASDWNRSEAIEVIVVSNGSSDGTAGLAHQMRTAFCERGWELRVIEREKGGKIAALNAGDRLARGGMRFYLDADVLVSPQLLSQLREVLDRAEPRYASGRLEISPPETRMTRFYARIYAKVPFMTHGVPGAGLFAVNAAGRLRWDVFPEIVSDDTFVRLSFAPSERISVEASYLWPMVEGWSNLVRVRRRQDRGVTEIKTLFPELVGNDDKPRFSVRAKARLALLDPIGFAVYAAVAVAVRLGVRPSSEWSRGR